MCWLQTVQAKPAIIISLKKFQKNFKIVCPKKVQKRSKKFQKMGIGPLQVKCKLLISSIFDAMNFQHFLEKL